MCEPPSHIGVYSKFIMMNVTVKIDYCVPGNFRKTSVHCYTLLGF